MLRAHTISYANDDTVSMCGFKPVHIISDQLYLTAWSYFFMVLRPLFGSHLLGHDGQAGNKIKTFEI
jgi:hypothetical protein